MEITLTAVPENTQNQAPLRQSNGRFAAGFSGNRGGRPRILADLQALARAHTAEALSTLVEIALDGSAPAAARVAASCALIDRAWGRPCQAVEVHSPATNLNPESFRQAFDDAVAGTLRAMAAQMQYARRDAAELSPPLDSRDAR